MAIIKCPECGHQVSDKAATCPSCGVGIHGKVTKCPECGEFVFNDQPLCPNCHCPLEQKSDEGRQTESAVNTPNTLDSSTSSIQASGNSTVGSATKPNKKSWTPWIVAFVIALCIVFVGLYFYMSSQVKNELEAYENAMQSSEPAVLQNFLDIYNDAPREHRDSVSSHLEMLKRVDQDWTNAIVSNSKSALLRYIQLHPNSTHNVEAKIKIDSLDWIDASVKNTAESYQKYIAEHSDGMYIDQAHDAFAQMDAKKVNMDDKERISSIFSTFFNALGQNDETTLTLCVDNILTSFLHKANASKTDVIGYMHKIHAADVSKVDFRMNNDWRIEKTDDGNGNFMYNVNFSVDQNIEHFEDGDKSFNTFKVNAKVSSDDKITELNMQRIVQ
ncbi:MAG: zinc ribbon domain-containing protein [Prevotellaceae bacterium]|nr:zinc ribbon domain-containing protein [Prevotellaceae bacterium]